MDTDPFDYRGRIGQMILNITEKYQSLETLMAMAYPKGSVVTFTYNSKQINPSRGIVQGYDGRRFEIIVKKMNKPKKTWKEIHRVFYRDIIGVEKCAN